MLCGIKNIYTEFSIDKHKNYIGYILIIINPSGKQLQIKLYQILLSMENKIEFSALHRSSNLGLLENQLHEKKCKFAEAYLSHNVLEV